MGDQGDDCFGNNVDSLANPPLPLWHGVVGGIQPGKMIEIRGTVPYGSDTFQINLTDGIDSGSYKADRILHMSVRFAQKVVVRNSLARENWGTEERTGGFPFIPGRSFILLILVEQVSYKIAVNGQHQWEYVHRRSVDCAKVLYINGSVRIDQVHIFDKHFPGSPTGTCVPQPGFQPIMTISNPSLPFCGTLPWELKRGKIVEVTGFIPKEANVFTVSLSSGRNNGAYRTDTPLHISVRFDGCIVVRNTFRHGSWEGEERAGCFPFGRGEQFMLSVSSNQNRFRISVDGRLCWEFVHRFPVSFAKMLHIDGAVHVFQINFKDDSTLNNNTVKTPAVLQQRTLSAPLTVNRSKSKRNAPVVEQLRITSALRIANPKIPYLHPLPGGLKRGLIIYISGKPTPDAEKFVLSLCCSCDPHPPRDVAFRFDARLYSNTVVRNSLIDGRWSPKETHAPHFPFKQNTGFDMVIVVEAEKYNVAVNGRNFAHFTHVMKNLRRINRFYIEGDVSVSCIRFIAA